MDPKEPLACKGCEHPRTVIAWREILRGYFCEDCYQSYWDHMADMWQDDELTQ